jgi:ABC-type multidrug transport system fused ATPase/permease subunit
MKNIKTKSKVRRLAALAVHDRGYVVAGTICLTIAAFMQVLIPKLTGDIIDSISIDQNKVRMCVNGRICMHESSALYTHTTMYMYVCRYLYSLSSPQDEFYRNIGWMMIVSFLAGVFTAGRGWCFSVIFASVKVRIRELLYESLLKQEVGYFDVTKTGKITSVLSTDTSKVADTISLNINVLMRSTVQMVGTLGFMFYVNWRLTLLAFTVIPVIVAVSKVYGAYLRLLTRRGQDVLGEGNDLAEQVLGSMATVKSFATETLEFRRYRAEMNRFYGIQIDEANGYGGFAFVYTFLPNVAMAVVRVCVCVCVCACI